MILLLAILAAFVGCKLDLTGRSTVFVEESFNQHGTTKVLKVSNTQLAYLEMEGFGEATIYIKNLKSGSEKYVHCRVYDAIICMLWNLEIAQFDPKAEFEVKATVDVYNAKLPYVSVRLVGSDTVELGAVDRYSFNFEGANSVDLLVSFKDMPKNLDTKGKIQFFTLQGFGGKLLSSEYLKMFMKLGDVKVTALNADRTSTTTLAMGSVMTLIPSDKEYCFETNCFYSFKLETMNITHLWFQAVQMGSESVVEISQGNLFIDQLRDNDSANYMITSNVGDNTWNWRINLIPVEGNPDIAINGDTKPAKFEDYKWKSAMEGNEDIFITGKEIQGEGLTGNKFFMMTQAKKQTTFLMTVSKLPPLAHQHINPNEPLTGEAEPGEIVNYFFRGNVDIPEKIEIYAKIKAISGDPDLYVKSCLSYDTITCVITQDDINNAEALSQNQSMYFRYSSETYGDESKFLEFNCIPDLDKFANFTFKDNDLFNSRTCLFAVAVVGKSSTTHTDSKYIIELKGAKYHHAIVPDQGQNFRVEQGQRAFWYVDIDQTNFNETQDDQYVNFKFIIISGDVEIYFSRSYPYPTEDKQDKIVMVDNNNTQLYSTIKYASFRGKPSDLKGRYYFTMHATEFIFGSVVCTVGPDNLEDSKFARVKEISFGEAVMGSIIAKEDSQLEYFFTLNVPETQDGVEIILQLNSIEGVLDFCITNDAEKLNTWSECIWRDLNGDGNIIINSDDPNFKKKGKYGVFIIPKISDSSEGSEYTFTMALSSGDSYIPLTEGLAYKIAVLRSPKILRIAFPANSVPVADVFILLSTLDARGRIEASTNREDLDESKIDDENTKSASGPQATLKYSLHEIKESCSEYWKNEASCFIYIKVTPSQITPYEYSILVYGDDKYVFLNEGAEQNLPMPINAEIELEYTPRTTNKSLSINVYSDAATMEVTVDVRRAGTTDRTGAVTYVANDQGTNIVHIPTEVLAFLEAPVVKINIVNLDVKRNPEQFTTDMYDINERITVQVSSGLKRLNHLVPIYETQGTKGSFIFYKFVKPAYTNAMIYLTVYSGEADLYAKKGEDEFPDLNTFDFRSNSLNNDELMIPADKNSTSANTKFETYIIGVYSRMPSSFQLVASKNSSFLYQQACIDTIITKEVPPGSSLIVSYTHKFSGAFLIGAYGSKGKVNVQYKSHDESKEDEFFKTLPTFSDPGFTATNKFITRHMVQPLLGAPKDLQYLVMFTPASGSDYVTLFFENEGDSLYVKGGETINDMLENHTCQKYNVVYDEDVIDENIGLNVMSGEVSLVISKIGDEDMMMLRNDAIPAPKSKLFKLSDIFNRAPAAKGTMNVFKEYQAEVCANKDQSAYSLRTSKPSLTMLRLIPGARFILSLRQKQGVQKVYYHKIHTSNIKSIVVKIDLQVLGKASSKITDLSKIFELIDFYYVMDADTYGYEGDIDSAIEKDKVQAEVVNNWTLTDSGSQTGFIKLGVQDGIFVIRGKTNIFKATSASMQFIVNDVFPISLLGKTMSYLTPSEEQTYEVIKPPNSTLSLSFSGCQGTTRVEIFKVDPKTDDRQSIRTLTIGAISRDEDFINAEQLQGEVVTYKLTDQESIIKLTNINPRSNSSVTIDSDLVTPSSSMTISDYFAQYGNREVNILNDLKYGDDIHKIIVILNHLKPAKGFADKYKQFHRVIIDYTVYMMRENPNFPSSKQCVIKPESIKRKIANSTTNRLDLHIFDGEIDFTQDDLVKLELPYDEVNPSYYLLIQARLTFLGEDSDSADDDAVVLVASTFAIGRPSNLPNFGHPAFAIIAVVILICLGLACYRIYQIGKANRSTAAVRRVVEDNVFAGSRQIETIENENTVPDQEVELETSKKPVDMNDTL